MTTETERLATRDQRILNYIVDTAAIFGVSMVFGFLLGIVLEARGQDVEAFLETFPDLLIGWILFVAYYTLTEFLFGRTLGKLATRTKVVSLDGGKPSFGQILGRSLCRCIPFEFISFLGSDARGWHDSIPKTKVVSVPKRSKPSQSSDEPGAPLAE